MEYGPPFLSASNYYGSRTVATLRLSSLVSRPVAHSRDSLCINLRSSRLGAFWKLEQASDCRPLLVRGPVGSTLAGERALAT